MNKNLCLLKEIDEYKKKLGKLNEAKIRRILSNYTIITIDAKDKSNNIRKRLAASNKRVVEQSNQIK